MDRYTWVHIEVVSTYKKNSMIPQNSISESYLNSRFIISLGNMDVCLMGKLNKNRFLRNSTNPECPMFWTR
jgi:hypothetical protein